MRTKASSARARKPQQVMAESYGAGYEAGVRMAAAEVERKHIEGGHHGPDHNCRTRNWILGLVAKVSE